MLRVTLLTTLLLIGCGSRVTTVSGISQSSSSFSSGGDGVPGIDSGMVNRITLKAGPPEGVTFVIWSDLTGSSGHGGTSPWTAGRKAHYQGKLTGRDGREVLFRINTKDGVSGVLDFENESLRFNTDDGELILVSTAQGKLRALQSQFALSQLPTDAGQFSNFAASNPTISTFFNESASGGSDSSIPAIDLPAEEMPAEGEDLPSPPTAE